MADKPYEWPNRREVLDFLARHGTSSADDAVIARPQRTLANNVEVAVRAALHALEANGWIKFTPPTTAYSYHITPPESE